MADNVNITPGTGATVAADDIGGALYQRVKIVVGSDGVNTGDVSTANKLPVVDTTAQTSLSSIDGKLPALSDGKVPIQGSVTVTGVATADNQEAANTSLSSIDTKTPSLVSGRVPVDSSGVTQPVSATALPLPTGAATASNQATANTSLSSIDNKLPALSSGRVPVESAGTVISTYTQASASVSTTSGSALAANANRKHATLFNNSAVDIWLGLGIAAAVDQGIPLKAGTGYEINTLNLFKGAINAIAESGTASLAIAEGV